MTEYLTALAHQPVPLASLQAELIARGEQENVVDAVYRHVDTPIGTIFVAATPRGIARLGFSHETDALQKLTTDVGPRTLPAGPAPTNPLGERPATAEEMLDRGTFELQEYFAGNRRAFTVPIDLHLAGFRGDVVRALATIDYGRRASYKELAEQIGNPGAVRAVGSACASNPIPIFLPCHRVVRSDGTWGNYRGGEEAKTYLLELERAA